jgi:hypothetical protein
MPSLATPSRALPCLCLLAALAASPARADDAPVAMATPVTAPEALAPRPTPADPTVEPSRWSAGFQSTYVWQRKPGFAAPYSGPKSLSTEAETAYTLTATAYLGARPWEGGELFFNPESIQSQELSGLTGLAGLSNGEAQKSGGPTANLYRARLFLRQTIGLGGEESQVEAGPNQVAGKLSSHRLVVTAGNFSIADVFDGNRFSHDPRTQFLNWSLMSYGAFDYAADVRGYTWGLAVEWYRDDWALRVGRFAQPRVSNGLALDLDLLRHYGDSIEVEHAHTLLGQQGKVKVNGFRNYARMGAFADARRLASASGTAPNVADVRRDQAKMGLGVGLEQDILKDVGVFARFSWNDGRTETYAFTEIERSTMAGVSVKGTRWRRENDTLGVAWVQNELSAEHRAYVEAGGAGLFIGDGAIRYRPERIVEAYYSFRAFDRLWITADAQRIANPAYNADRGPVNILGWRVHVEY